MDFKVGDYVYASDWCCGVITEIQGNTAYVEFETEGGGGCVPFGVDELEHARCFRNAITDMCYKLYKIDWKHNHNIGREEEMKSVKSFYKHLEEIGQDESYFPYECFIEEFGYDGEIYASFSEFCDAEYRDSDYIRELLNDDKLFAEYKSDINRR